MNVVALLGGVRGTIFAGLALLALLFATVQTVRLQSVQHQLEVQKTALLVNAKEFAEWKLAEEARTAAAVAAVDKRHHEEQKDAQAKADRVVADLRNDVVRLRQRFTCPPRGQPSPTDAPISRADDEGIGGLTEQDAEFLVREAADSDRKSIKINALIEIIEEYLKKEK